MTNMHDDDDSFATENMQTSQTNAPTSPLKPKSDISWSDIGDKLFQYKEFLPIPLIILMLFLSKPSAISATLGTILILGGELLRIYSLSFLDLDALDREKDPSSSAADQSGREGPMSAFAFPQGHRLTTVVKAGPYAFVRHPIYIANFAIAIGFAVFSGHNFIVILTAGLFAFLYHHLAIHEDRALLAKHGEPFQTYKDTVPGWVPIRVPSLEDLQWPETFTPAIRREQKVIYGIGFLILAMLLLSAKKIG